MAGVDLNLSGAVRRTNKGSVDFYYGGGDEAWANLAAAYAGIPSVIRNGKVFGVITAGVISEYWWNDATALADGDEIPYAQGGTTLTTDQVDAIDNANAPDAGNPFATMADIVSGVVYQGAWNANTNTPTLVSSTGTQGYYYVVSVAGTTNLNGITDWEAGDWAIFNGAVWQKVDNTDNPTVWGGITGNILDQTDVGARKDTYHNVFIGGGNDTNTLSGSAGNAFLSDAAFNDLTGSGSNYFGINANANTLVDSSYNYFSENTQGITLNTSLYNIFGNGVSNFNPINTNFDYCTVASGDYLTIDFTNATQLFGRSAYWSINKILGTDLIEVTFDANLATSQTGQYDTSTDTFYPYGGTYTPTLTPDGSICTAATLIGTPMYKVENGFMTVALLMDATFDFSGGSDGTIDYTIPFGSIDFSNGSVTFGLSPNSPSFPISGYERNGQIHATSKDVSFNDPIIVQATITIKLA